MKHIAFIFSLFLVSACTVEAPTALPEVPVTQESSEKFALQMGSFTDARTPRARETSVSQDVLYEYDADQLLSSVKYRMPKLLEKHFNAESDVTPFYTTEIHLKDLRQFIKAGGVFTGGFGEYVAKMKLYTIVRNTDESVLWEGETDVEVSANRTSYKGRAPGSQLDRQKMFDVTERAIRLASQRITRKVLGAHNAQDGFNLF